MCNKETDAWKTAFPKAQQKARKLAHRQLAADSVGTG